MTGALSEIYTPLTPVGVMGPKYICAGMSTWKSTGYALGPWNSTWKSTRLTGWELAHWFRGYKPQPQISLIRLSTWHCFTYVEP